SPSARTDRMPDALFERDGARFVPTELCRGPWSPDAQHGGPPAALLARAAERFEGGEEMAVARLTVELLRPVPLVPLTVAARWARPGRKVQIVEASLRPGDREGATALRLRRRRLRPARAGARLDPPARPAGGRRADLAALPRRRRGRLRQRRQLGAVAPRGLHLHQPGPHHLPPPDAGGRVGLPRGRDLAVARRHRLLRDPPVGRA